jgi:DNA-binding transcriptional LysR family regulator
MKAMSDLVDWDDQRAFLAVLETGSLSAAARRLGVAQPTVRHRIEALERAVGAALFTRSAGGLVPTEGARALGRHARAMALASEAFMRAASAPPGEVAGTVRLSVSEFVGIEVLPPMLARLRARHPALAVEVHLSDAPADLPDQEADVAIRMHPPRQGPLVARKVGAIPLGFFAHRDYVERRGAPASLAELAAHDLIGPDRRRADLDLAAALHPALTRSAFAIRIDSHPAQLAAVRAGLGIGVVQRPAGLADPLLEPILPDFVLAEMETWVVAHEDLRRLPRVRAAFEHFASEFLQLTGGGRSRATAESPSAAFTPRRDPL